MGLDMYLTGEKYLHGRSNKRGTKKGELYDLGYWRKHPNLHGYIVQTFANCVDECQDIDLSADALKKIIQAVKDRELPETTGFFSAKSYGTPEEAAEDIQIFEEALAWLQTPEEGVWRSVSYRASW